MVLRFQLGVQLVYTVNGTKVSTWSAVTVVYTVIGTQVSTWSAVSLYF